MPEELPAEWQLRDSLPDDFVAAIVNPYFGTLPSYQEGTQTLVIFPLLPLEGVEFEREQTVIYRPGDGWLIRDGGQSMYHPEKNQIPKSSLYGKFIRRVLEGLKEDFAKHGVDIIKRGKPTEAKTWHLLIFRWKREDVVYGKVLEDRGGVTGRLFPVEFKGVLEDRAAPAAVTGRSGQATSPELMQKLKEMALKHNSAQDFILDAVGEVMQSVEDVQLRAHILDKDSTGFWAKTRAEAAQAT
jgi:hypothetical protein